MLKKNKLSLFLLAVVMMLSVYYINMPDNEPSLDKPVVGESTNRHPEYASKRLEMLVQREIEIGELENKLASASTDEEKVAVFNEMQDIFDLTANEVSLEKKIIDLGFDDCLVITVNQLVYVATLDRVVTDPEYTEIYLLVQQTMGEFYYPICDVVVGDLII